MLYAKIETGDTLYIFLHAEQVYRNFGLCDKDLGYFNYEIAEPTINSIYDYIKDHTTNIANIIIDCAEIVEAHNISDSIRKTIDYCKENDKNLAFCRMSKSLYEKSKINEMFLSEQLNGDQTYNVFSPECKINSISDSDIYDLYKIILADKTKSNFLVERAGEDSYSHSSNVQLPKYINIKSFIEQRDYLFLGLYLLCKKAVQKNFIDYEKKPLLFFSSMAGSYLASVFSKLACIDMVFLNHLGPKKKLYRELHKEQLIADRGYLIFSDVVCLGAEIERAKTLIEHAGGILKGILSVVLVEIVSERPNKDKEIEKIALLNITKDYNPIEYKIKTDFQ